MFFCSWPRWTCWMMRWVSLEAADCRASSPGKHTDANFAHATTLAQNHPADGRRSFLTGRRSSRWAPRWRAAAQKGLAATRRDAKWWQRLDIPVRAARAFATDAEVRRRATTPVAPAPTTSRQWRGDPRWKRCRAVWKSPSTARCSPSPARQVRRDACSDGVLICG